MKGYQTQVVPAHKQKNQELGPFKEGEIFNQLLLDFSIGSGREEIIGRYTTNDKNIMHDNQHVDQNFESVIKLDSNPRE